MEGNFDISGEILSLSEGVRGGWGKKSDRKRRGGGGRSTKKYVILSGAVKNNWCTILRMEGGAGEV